MWLGQLVSKLGSQFNYIALAWLVLSQTGSGIATGGVYMAQVLPNALFGWVAGVAVDRGDKRRLMIRCDLGRAALVILIPIGWLLLGFHHLGLIYVLTFGVSLLTLVFFAAEKSIIPELVPDSELTEANAYAEMTEQAASLAGPVLAGVLIATLASPLDVLYLDAASFLVSATALWLLGWRDRKHPPAAAGWRAVLAEAWEGIHYLMRDRFLRVVFLTAASVNLLIAPFTVIFPVLSERVLHTGSVGFGWLMGGIGGGMLVGSLLAAALARRMSAPLLIYGGMALIGAAFLSMGFSRSLSASVMLAALAGFCLAPANALFLTLVQEGTPPALQGRVFGSLFALMNLTVPLGVALVSPLLDHLGPPEVLWGVGGFTMVAAVIGRLVLGDSRPERSRPDRREAPDA
ncbi:MAG: MFS transporter [Armatimonadetes bacterium]|nr:MFS transporter [Armatimonadota bacterium]